MKKIIKHLGVLGMLLLVGPQLVAQFNPMSNNTKLFNAGIGISGWGIPVYVSLELPVADNITVGGGLSYQSDSERFGTAKWTHNIFGISAIGNYHFGEAISASDKVDLYAGLSVSYYSWNTKSSNADINYSGSGSGGAGVGAQVGVRYFFSENLGANLELGGGSVLSAGRLGITLTF